MKTHVLFLLITLSLLALTSATASLRRSALVGGYKPIKDLKDAHVVDIAQFAVSEHNKLQGTKLKYLNIINGERQLVHGFNYRLTISADDAGDHHDYAAVVYEGFSGEQDRKLVSFERMLKP